MGRNTTGGGVGTNQYQVRGASTQTPNVVAPPISTTPQRRKCGQVWGSKCNTWVQAPGWSHGQHPTYADQYDAARKSKEPEVLALLVDSQVTSIRAAVAQNPATPPALLDRLANDSEDTVLENIIRHPAASQDALREIALHMQSRYYGHWRLHMVVHPNVPAEALTGLACEQDQMIRRSAAQHPNCPATTREAVADPERYRDYLHRMASDSRVWVHQTIAGNKQASPATLALIATSSDDTARYRAAQNPNTSPDTLTRLAHDRSPAVRKVATNHHRLPNDAAMRLARDKVGDIRIVLAESLFVSPQALQYMAENDTSRLVLSKVAKHPDTPGDALTALAASEDLSIFEAALTHPNCPVTTLTQYATDPEWRKRRAVASHPVCPPQSLSRLISDSSAQVRVAVRHNPNCPDHIRAIFALGAT